jgi:FKBP-type peptidyl-prolyl cis-trans isomerase SlyD
MKIEHSSVVTLITKIVDFKKNILNPGVNPVTYLHGVEWMPVAIEQALVGQEKGFQVTLKLEAKDAFGELDETLKKMINKNEFPSGIKIGGMLNLFDENMIEREYRVIKIKGNQVFLDANSLLAGIAMTIEIKIMDVRTATLEEISHGHAHGDHGHHH